MRQSRLFILLSWLWAGALPLVAQDPLRKIDSLVRVLNKDTVRLGQVIHPSPNAASQEQGPIHDRAIEGIAGSIILLMGNHVDKAAQLVDRSIDLLGDAPDEHTLACAVYYRGRVELVRNNIAGAVVQFERALRVTARLEYPKLEALLEEGIGKAYGELKDFEKSRTHLLRALEKGPSARTEVSIISALVEAEARVHAFEDAEMHIARMQVLMDSLGFDRVHVDLVRGELLMERGEHELAIELLNKALTYFMRDGQPLSMAPYIMSRLSVAYRLSGQGAEAVRIADQGVRLSERKGLRKELQDNEGELYRAYAALGNKAKAYDHLQRYLALQDSATGIAASGVVGTAVIRSEMARQARADSLLRAERDKRSAIEQQAERSRQHYIRNMALLGAGVVLILAIGLWNRLRSTRRSRAMIQREKEISEGLLLNILPAEVAVELKAKGSAQAVQIEQVTVLFTDFKGFTAMSEKVTPRELVHDLHECFSAFDRITEKYGIEKIKTIGDAYMAAGGLPTPNTTHATDVIKAALEMRDFIAEGKARKVAAGLPYFEIRIGIHTGPVVAGIVGVKKFQYDIWGDTVNTASRMESSGEVGQVNISEATYAMVKDVPGLTFTPRGKVLAKGKGDMEMYFVSRIEAVA